MVLGIYATNCTTAGLMNFITHKDAVSLFPQLTLDQRVFYMASKHPLGEKWKAPWVDKYEMRGFHVDVWSNEAEMHKRSVRDERSWTFRFDGESQSTSSKPGTYPE